MDLQLSPEVVRVATFLSFIASTACILLLQKKRETSLAHRHARRKKKELGHVNIGAIFGMDVGGTLTKIVYFEAKRAEKDSNGEDPFGKKDEERPRSKRPELAQRGSSDSLAQLDCPDHQAALEHFYTFMDNNRGTSPRSAVVRDEALSLYSKFLDGKLHFLHFETRNMVDAIKYVSSAAPIENIRSIGCTGGGAHKFAGEFEEELEITFNKFDELECLVRGMHFALNNFPDECFTYRPEETPESAAPLSTESSSGRDTASAQASSGASTVRITEPAPSPSRAHPRSQAHNTEHTTPSIDEDTTIDASSAPRRENREPAAAPQTPKSPMKKDLKEYTRRVLLPFHSGGNGAAAFPYLVVNIGSGVSILKVTGPGKAERVSGTSLGGGTYWGLCRLLTKCESYEEVLDFAERGDASVVDMLVKDIYGGDYGSKLSGTMVASSFGKLVTKEDPRQGVREEDLALALLMMITNNIGQVAYLVAQLQKCSKIFFVGNFLRQNPISCRRLAYAISFWSAGKMEAMFLAHEGHFGALGTFLASAFGEDVDRVISIDNVSKSTKAKGAAKEAPWAAAATAGAAGGGADGGSAVPGEYRKSRSADRMDSMPETSQSIITEGPLYQTVAPASLRNLRGRSFSDDYATRTIKDRTASSPKSSPLSSSAVGTSNNNKPPVVEARGTAPADPTVKESAE